MERLICAGCESFVGVDEVTCPKCSTILFGSGATRTVEWTADEAAQTPPRPDMVDSSVPAPDAGPECSRCPDCSAPVSVGDLVCLACVRELPPLEPNRPARVAPTPKVTVREYTSTELRLSFDTGDVLLGDGEEVVLGRDPASSPVAERFTAYDNVSRKHATVGLPRDGAPWIRDEGSTNGTYVDESRLAVGEKRRLRDGCAVRLASDVIARVRYFGGSAERVVL
ncbi:FHA domain-containing protein [Embleya sp. NPDC059237]|uniref:FHA domain-containing protein n=1 Tax=Embleya sp. NPDC059237 TaxID=3346784 RepID=UPI0036977D55